IATAGQHAAVAALVVVDAVAVVAALARALGPVAAHIVGAIGLAGLVVAIVRPGVTLLADLHDPIATSRGRTIVGARIEGVVIPVVAGLHALVNQAIATDRARARVGARVGITVVAVVAVFTG